MSASYRQGASSVNQDREDAKQPTTNQIQCDPLVYSRISQKNSPHHILGFVLYKQSLKVLKDCIPSVKIQISNVINSKRGKIDSFSESSRRRLKFVCINSNDVLTSQYCLTYHENLPADGLEIKRQLNSFLSRLRYRYFGFKYLWVLEFQTKRGVPHFHLFSNIDVDMTNRHYLAKAWNGIVGDSESHYKFHAHTRNFIPWNMGRGNYLAQKYLGKEEQKLIPANFRNAGRFWGCTRGLVKPVETISTKKLLTQFEHQVNPLTWEYSIPEDHLTYLYRVLRKHHESNVKFHQKYIRPKASNAVCVASLDSDNIGKKCSFFVQREGKYRRFKSQISRNYSAVLPFSAPIFHQTIEYLLENYSKVPF